MHASLLASHIAIYSYLMYGNCYIPLDMRTIIIMITVIFMDYANSQYPDCADGACPYGE